MIGPLQITGAASSSRSRLTDIILVSSFATHGIMESSVPLAFSCTPYIFGIDGPVTSASRIPTVYPFSRIILARDAVTSDFPTPPFPLTTPITLLMDEYIFAGSRKSVFLLLQESACAHPAQDSSVQPFVFCSSDITKYLLSVHYSPVSGMETAHYQISIPHFGFHCIRQITCITLSH